MFNFDYIAKEDIEDRLYRILIVGVSGSGITIALLTLVSNKTGIYMEKIHLKQNIIY